MYDKRRLTTTDTWLTPPRIINDLGPFDLDPCAAPKPRPWSTAKHHITLPKNGLVVPWMGFVWCNPPYGDSMEDWLRRCADHDNGLALVYARTGTKQFFRHVWPNYKAALFLRGRIRFYRTDGSLASSAPAASMIIGWGEEAFKRLARSSLSGHLIVTAGIILRSNGKPAETWREVVEDALNGRKLRLREIYRMAADAPRVKRARGRGHNWKAQIRRALQVYCRSEGYGCWAPA